MRNLTRFFHFHEGTPLERAVKIVGTTLATIMLTIGTTAATISSASVHSSTSLNFASAPCDGGVVQGRTLSIQWLTTKDTARNYVMVGRDASYGTVLPASNGRVHTAALASVSSGERFHFRVASINESATIFSDDCTITIPGPDNSPPVILDLRNDLRSETELEFSVATNEASRAWLIVRPLLPSGFGHGHATPITDDGTTHRIIATSLRPETTYHATIFVMDGIGNTSQSETLVISTRRPGANDTTPPVIASASCVTTPRSILIEATIPESLARGLISYGHDHPSTMVEMANVDTDEDETLLRRTIRSLTPGTMYTIRLTALDAAGNATHHEAMTCTTANVGR
jgi:hypothetical protein